ncbi:MAG: efflux RND transporter permease subunit [Wenzhouxiangella sp.]
MILSDLAVTRPVLSAVAALLLVIFGIVSFQQLPLREYPDIDPPVVSVETNYRGAAAAVIDTQITEVIEDRIAGIEGIEFIESSSSDGESEINIRFSLNRDVDAAANDVRDRVSGILDNLPSEADPPEVQRVEANADVIVWWNLASPNHTIPELTDFAERFLVDRLSVIDGVARIRLGGARSYAMRVWLDREALAARELTVNDIERALRAENVELPAGAIESRTRQFTVRVQRQFATAGDFARLVIARGDDGYLVRLGDVARVERGTVEDRTLFRGNGDPMIGLGIIRQSTANTLAVAQAVRAEVGRLNQELPEGMQLLPSFDSSVFIEGAIDEVYRTLAIAIVLVILAIFLFLGSLRAIIVPAVAVPVSLVATFIALALFGFSVNLLTLLALVLAIGLVVDDGIIVLENIRRRMDDYGESSLVAAYRGTRQVGFAVVSTTLVLIAVFAPIALLQGDIGRLFAEFGLTMAAAVAFSSFVALTISAALAARVLKPRAGRNRLVGLIDAGVDRARRIYRQSLTGALKARWIVVGALVLMLAAVAWLFDRIPSEYAPFEDRGAFFVIVNGPEGATFEYMNDYMSEIEARLLPLVEDGEISRLLVRSPRAFGSNIANFNSGIAISVLQPWGQRRPARAIMADVQQRLGDLPGVQVAARMRQGFAQGFGNPVQFVIGGGTDYETLAEWRDTLLAAIDEDNPGLVNIDWDYKENQPQLEVLIDYDRAAELGVTVSNIGRTLETMLGSRRVTTYIEDGQEYDVIVEGERDRQRSPDALNNLYVRSERSGQLIPLSNLVQIENFAGSNTLNRYNRIRSITLEAGLAEDLTLGEALEYLRAKAREVLPEQAIIDYKGQSRDFMQAGGSMVFVFVLGLIVVFLVLAAQFENWIHPLVIILGVPLAVGGGLLGLWLTGASLNVYSQIGLVMLVGLAAKNGILIVEFINQLRDSGTAFEQAIIEASVIRLRPILMTGITTAAGAVPLILAAGAGAETRQVIGIVVLFGVLVSMVLTLFVVPVLYRLLAAGTGSPERVKRRLQRELGAEDSVGELAKSST